MDESGQFSESPFFQQYSTKSLVCVPLRAGETVVGVLSANNKHTGNPFDEHDLYMATIFSHLLLLTLQNAQFHYDRERTLVQDSRLIGLNRKAGRHAGTQSPVSHTPTETRAHHRIRKRVSVLLDENRTGCGIYYLEGIVLWNPSFQFLAGSVGGLPGSAGALVRSRWQEFQILKNLLRREILSWISVPIILQDKLAGSLELASPSPRKFKESDKQILSQIAQQAALAINNSRLYLKLLHSLKEVSEARKEVERIRRDQYL